MIDRIEINLLPAEYRVRKRTINIPRSIIWSAVAFLILASGAMFYTVHLRNIEAELIESIGTLEQEIAANAHIQDEIAKLRAEKDITDEKIKALQRINVNREKWVRLMETFSGKLPAYTWLLSIKEMGVAAAPSTAPNPPADEDPNAPPALPAEKIVIEARTYSFPEVAHYMNKLEESEYITSVELTSVEQIAGEGRMLYRFSISCVTNNNVGVGDTAAAESEEGGA